MCMRKMTRQKMLSWEKGHRKIESDGNERAREGRWETMKGRVKAGKRRKRGVNGEKADDEEREMIGIYMCM